MKKNDDFIHGQHETATRFQTVDVGVLGWIPEGSFYPLPLLYLVQLKIFWYIRAHGQRMWTFFRRNSDSDNQNLNWYTTPASLTSFNLRQLLTTNRKFHLIEMLGHINLSKREKESAKLGSEVEFTRDTL